MVTLMHCNVITRSMSVCALFLVLSVLSFRAGAVTTVEVDSLRDLYLSTAGAHWRWRPAALGAVWDFTTDPDTGEAPDPCAEEWQGVTCSGVVNTYISGLRLNRFNLTGTIPESICNLTRLQNLGLTINRISGSIPSRIGDMVQLTNLDFNNNLLTHTIPSRIGNLTNLIGLWLYYNSITGTIPRTVGSLHSLTMLELDSNSIVGGIPPTISSMTSLVEIYLYDNKLSKSIPSDIGELVNLVSFNAHTNAITGPIPASILQCTALEMFVIDSNKLTSSIPAQIGDLGSLTALYFQDNMLTGTIPPSVGKLTALTALGFASNFLWGTIPFEIMTLSDMFVLDISFNTLTGTIPHLGNLSSIEYLLLHSNLFSGSLPQDITQLTKLVVLDLIINELTGTLPSQLGLHMSDLQFLMMSDNYFTGTVPSSYLCLPSVLQVNLNSNALSGLIKQCSDNETAASLLSTLDVSGNSFHGNFPVSFTNFKHLHYLIISENKFDGSLGNVFNASHQLSMKVLDVSDNLFTGSIPFDFFLGKLEVFSATTNCIRGSLPDSLCSASTLVTFGLDGGGSASKCTQRQVFQLSSHPAVTNGLMPCLFDLPALDTLHLSGNGISGTLPPLRSNMSIRDLALAYNELSGTIPKDYQGRGWSKLDLSHNAFTGSLDPSVLTIPRNGSLYLLGNLLSGHLPTRVKHTEDISILKGNIFTCNYERDSLPVHDEYRESYSCGSTLANGALILWAIFIFAVLVISGISWKLFRTEVINGEHSSKASVVLSDSFCRWNLWYTTFFDPQHTSLCHVRQYLNDLELMCSFLMLFLIFILLPSFSTLTWYYHTYTYQYLWTTSAVLNSGGVPAAVLVVIWWILVWTYSVHFVFRVRVSKGLRSGSIWMMRMLREPPTALPSSSSVPLALQSSVIDSTFSARPISNFSKRQVKAIRISLYTLALLSNVVVVGGLNAAYVYVFFSYDAPNYTTLRFTQFGFAIFKVLWSAAVVPAMLHTVRHSVHRIIYNADDITSIEENTHGIEFQAFIVLLNNIAIPCVAAAIFSSHCFYDAVVEPPTVDVKYSFLSCATFGLIGEDLSCLSTFMKQHETSYIPTFTYRYQCSSDLVMEYVPIFLFMFFIVSLVVPSLQMFSNSVHKTNVTTRRSSYDDKMRAHEPQSTFLLFIFKFCSFFSSKTIKTLNIIHSQVRNYMAGSKFVPVSTIFNSDFFCVSILQNCAVILTFGICFPLLGVCGCTALMVQIGMTRFDLGRTLLELQGLRQQAVEGPTGCGPVAVFLDSCLKVLSKDCLKVKKFKDSALWLVVIYATIFHVIFAFDTLGRDAHWVSFVIVALFICLAPFTGLVFLYANSSLQNSSLPLI